LEEERGDGWGLSNPRRSGSERFVAISWMIPASVTITIILTFFLGSSGNAMADEGDADDGGNSDDDDDDGVVTV